MTTAKPLEKFASGPANDLPARVKAAFSPWTKTLLSALGLSIIAMALTQPLASIEARLAEELAPALSELLGSDSITDAQWTRFIQVTMVFLVTALSIETGKRQKQSLPLAVITLQLNLLAFIAQALVFRVQPTIFCTAIATAAAAAFGIHLRQSAERNKLLESRYYENIIRNQELAQARLELAKQDEMERRLLAADLHDQVLNDLKKILESFSQFEKNPQDTEASMRIRGGFSKTMNDIREIMDDLCPIMLQNFGMRAAIEDCLDKGRERSGYETNFNCKVEDEILDNLSAVQQSLLFRLVQESLTNISKHAQASNVSVLLEIKRDKLEISIEDDGKGIDYEKISHQSRGLRYMKLRADLLDAVIDWKRGSNNKGTKVVISYPLNETPRA